MFPLLEHAVCMILLIGKQGRREGEGEGGGGGGGSKGFRNSPAKFRLLQAGLAP